MTNISQYGLWGCIGFGAGIIYLCISLHKNKSRIEDYIYVYAWSAISCLVGAKILYILVEVINSLIYSVKTEITLDVIVAYCKGGFVYYGGALGAIVGAILGARYFNLETNKVLDTLIPTLPLAHGFARIGCYRVGCCYGRITTSHIEVTYSNSIYAPNDVPLVPVQLIEAIVEMILFLSLLVLSHVKQNQIRNMSMTTLYLLVYAIARFILEFYRGDSARGSIGPFSTSQWISLLIIAGVAFLFFRKICCKKTISGY